MQRERAAKSEESREAAVRQGAREQTRLQQLRLELSVACPQLLYGQLESLALASVLLPLRRQLRLCRRLRRLRRRLVGSNRLPHHHFSHHHTLRGPC